MNDNLLVILVLYIFIKEISEVWELVLVMTKKAYPHYRTYSVQPRQLPLNG